MAKCNLGKVKKESMLVSGHSLKIWVGTSALIIRVLSAWSELDLFLARAIYLVDTLGFRALALCWPTHPHLEGNARVSIHSTAVTVWLVPEVGCGGVAMVTSAQGVASPLWLGTNPPITSIGDLFLVFAY